MLWLCSTELINMRQTVASNTSLAKPLAAENTSKMESLGQPQYDVELIVTPALTNLLIDRVAGNSIQGYV